MLKEREKEHRPEKNEDFRASSNKIFFLNLLLFLIFSIYSLLFLNQFVCLVNAAKAEDNPVVAPKVEGAEKDKTTKSDKTESLNILPGQNLKDLNDLEEKIFHQNFISDSVEDRLSRLENFIFGKTNPTEKLEIRLNKLTTALQTPITPAEKDKTKTTELLQPQHIEPQAYKNEKIKEEQEVLYDESFNVGVVGAISQIEKRVFNKTFNELPFQARVAALEEKLLTKSELVKNRNKPLLERVSLLVKRSEINTYTYDQTPQPVPYQQGQGQGQGLQNNNQVKGGVKSYIIDPRTGLLINEQTGQVVKDSDGNPISVMISKSIPTETFTQPNYGYNPPPSYGYNPSLNQFNPGVLPGNTLQQQYLPGQFPYDLLFDQGGAGNSNDPGY